MYVDVEYSDDLVQPAKAAILVVLDPVPHGEWVTVLGDFRALKVSGRRDEVRIEGPGFDHRNGMAAGVGWTAERIAIAFLDASAAPAGLASRAGSSQDARLPRDEPARSRAA
jgi:hypothetical protein